MWNDLRLRLLLLAALTALPGCESGSGSAGSAPATPAPQAALEGAWRLVGYRAEGRDEEPVGPEPPYTIEFQPQEMRIAGQAHCNRYFGGYTQPGPGSLDIGTVGATLAMCSQPSLANEFLRALDLATAFELAADRLMLAFGNGGTLEFARQVPPAAAAAAPEVGRTFVYDCDGGPSFTVRTGPGEVALWSPPELAPYTVLSQTPAASGARYQEGGTVFWSRGDVATFEVGGQRYVDCKSNPRKVPWADAARRGVTLRALGHEPEWTFEVQGTDLLIVVTQLGTARTEIAYTAPTVAGTTQTYRTTGFGHELVAAVTRAPCTDSMSGEAFDASVTLTLDGTAYRGCGRFL